MALPASWLDTSVNMALPALLPEKIVISSVRDSEIRYFSAELQDEFYRRADNIKAIKSVQNEICTESTVSSIP